MKAQGPLVYGAQILFGVLEVKPLQNLPEGTTHTRLRMRNDNFAMLICRGPWGVRKFAIADHGTHWEPDYLAEQDRNVTHPTRKTANLRASGAIRTETLAGETNAFLGRGEARREAV